MQASVIALEKEGEDTEVELPLPDLILMGLINSVY